MTQDVTRLPRQTLAPHSVVERPGHVMCFLQPKRTEQLKCVIWCWYSPIIYPVFSRLIKNKHGKVGSELIKLAEFNQDMKSTEGSNQNAVKAMCFHVPFLHGT